MSFYIYLIGLTLITIILVYLKNKDLKILGWPKIKGVPIFYAILINTSLGIKLADFIAERMGKFLKVIGRIAYILTFLIMVSTIFLLGLQLWKFILSLLNPSIPPPPIEDGMMLVLPVQTPYSLYVPVQHWLLALIVVAVVHEFGHAVYSRIEKLRINSTGPAVFGIVVPLIPGAFVDVDETDMKSASKESKVLVAQAGALFNIITGLICLGVLFTLIHFNGSQYLKEVFVWLSLMNLGVGMFNLYPLPILDGGLIVSAIFGKNKWTMITINIVCLVLLLGNLLIPYIK